MSSIFFLILALLGFFLGYSIYLKFLVRKIFPLQPEKKTPAWENSDGVDYIPAKNWLILFGHHFASIAGAAPILGPVIAFSIWGWAPAILWIVLGSVFLGGVHDFSSLYVSMRNKGVSISEIGERAISKRTKYLFSIFIVLTLILIIAVFLYFCSRTFVNKPEVVLPSLGLIPVAMIVGFLIYRLNFSSFFATILGLLSLVLLAYLGKLFPVVFGLNIWILVLIVYCIFASITPVNILLQPRDYLSSFLLFAGIGLGISGFFIKRHPILAPAFISFNGQLGPLWPMLFVTIACGAISGFHSLIASGTTSKQIPNEIYAPRIGYGGMLLEGLLATIALLSVAIIAPDILKTTVKEAGPVGAFGKGYGIVVFPILGSYGSAFAVLILNAFILTTLDTATRITRYVLNEVFNWKNKFSSTLIPVIFAGFLALSGKWVNIWAIFGAANQLIAALALIVISGWLMRQERIIRYTFIPAVFMLVTTIFALAYKFSLFLREKNWTLSFISLILIFLGLAVVWEAKFIWKFRRKH